MNCKSCGAALSAGYLFCPDCGETAHPHRLDIKHVFHEFIHAFLHADKGIFLLVKELALHPGKAALKYAEGSRKKYFNPVSFLLITGGISFFLRYKLGFKGVIGSKKIIFFLGEFLHQYTTLIIILTIPLLSVYSWLFFKSSGKNYAENMVMNMYMMGEYHLFNIILLILPSYFFPQLNSVFTVAALLAMFVYYYFTCIYFFKQTTAVTLFKIIAVELLYVLTFGLLMGLSFIFFLIQSGVHIKDLK
jgi:Protein of unknown function (DUF3667)